MVTKAEVRMTSRICSPRPLGESSSSAPITSTNRRARTTTWGSRSPLSSAASPSRRRSPSSMATRYQTRRQSTRRSPLALPRPPAAAMRSCRPNALTPAPATLDPSNFLTFRDVHTACVRPTWVGESAARLGTRQSLNRRTSRDLAWTFAPTSYGSWCPPTPSLRGCRTSAPRSRRARLSCCGEAWCEHRQQSRHSTQHAARMVHARCMPSVRVACIGQATHDGWHVRYGGGELSTEWVTSGQAALLWHALTPTMHATTLQRSRVRVPGLAAARGRPALQMPTHLLRATLWAPTPLRRLPTPLRLAFGRARPEEEVGTHAAATLQRYYAFCAAAESTPGLVVG